MNDSMPLNYHQSQAIADRATRLRSSASANRLHGHTGRERIVLTTESPYIDPDARGGIFFIVEGHGDAPVPLFAKDLGHERNFEASRLPGRDENGHVYHPDMDGIGFDEFDIGPQLRAIGWLSATVRFEWDGSAEQRYRYSNSNSADCSYWTPSLPHGDGWLLAAIYDTEDGPAALYVRNADYASSLVELQPVARVFAHPEPGARFNKVASLLSDLPVGTYLYASPPRAQGGA
jgi:hypothetical protein